MNNFNEIKPGDIFSEISHYSVKEVTKTNLSLEHLESKNMITLDKKYAENLLSSADQYQSEVEVTKEDSKPDNNGYVKQGIRSIFEGIHSSEVFCVSFQKQDEVLSATKLKKLQEEQVEEGIKEIEDTQKNKKGVANKAKEILAKIQQNPILPYIPGEERLLRGYKIQFDSRDGKYNCVDMDIAELKPGSNIRPVNINSLNWIVYKGVKYIVKTR